MTTRPISLAGHVGRLWGLAGVAMLLAQAVMRLSRHAADGLRMELSPLHWLALGAWLLVMIYFEGIRGFQRGFSPRDRCCSISSRTAG